VRITRGPGQGGRRSGEATFILGGADRRTKSHGLIRSFPRQTRSLARRKHHSCRSVRAIRQAPLGWRGPSQTLHSKTPPACLVSQVITRRSQLTVGPPSKWRSIAATARNRPSAQLERGPSRSSQIKQAWDQKSALQALQQLPRFAWEAKADSRPPPPAERSPSPPHAPCNRCPAGSPQGIGPIPTWCGGWCGEGPPALLGPSTKGGRPITSLPWQAAAADHFGILLGAHDRRGPRQRVAASSPPVSSQRQSASPKPSANSGQSLCRGQRGDHPTSVPRRQRRTERDSSQAKGMGRFKRRDDASSSLTRCRHQGLLVGTARIRPPSSLR